MPLLSSLALGAALLGLLYWWGRRGQDFFSRQGVPGPPPRPFLGNIGLFASKTRCYNFIELKRLYGKIYGMFYGHQPFLILHDLDLIKRVLVKDFASFPDRWMININPSPVDKGIFFVKGDDWRRQRKIISPTFSGNKLRKMCGQINRCAQVLTQKLLDRAARKEAVDVKDLFGAYTMDTIALTAFGLEIHFESDSTNPFITHAQKIFTHSFFSKPLIFLMFLSPWFNKFTVSAWPMDVVRFFVREVQTTLERRRNQQSRVDFLQLLLDAEADDVSDTGSDAAQVKANRLTTDEIIGQAFLFFIAGFETSATSLNFLSHAITVHPHIQEKMYKEIMTELGEAEPDLDNIGKLKYMEQVLYETLRLYPPVTMINRLVSEECMVGGVKLEPGTAVGIPVYAIHHDPDLYPDPETFDPERFAPEGKASRHPMAFLPFGQGPRMCLGVRLAMTEAKIALARVLRHVRFVRCPQTKERLELVDRGTLQLAEPNVLGIESRSG